jgi:aspartyl-tRNA(Asn)/glutamyl-tRNA(Gln) amidotransferase subunit B
LDKYQKLHEITEVAQDELESIIQQVLAHNPDVVKKYRKGKTQVLGFLMGQVMQEFKQKIDPQQVRQELQNVLDQN